MARVFKADMDDMVFEDRERSYGAFLLRKRYPKHLLIGTLIVCLGGSLFGTAPVWAKFFGFTEEVAKPKSIEIVLTMDKLKPPPPVDPKSPPPTPPPKTPPPMKTKEFKIPEPAPEDLVDPEDQNIATVEELKDAPAIGLADVDGEEFVEFTGEIEEYIPEVIVEKGAPGIEEFVFAEEEPRPVNMNEISNLIGYPQIARDAGIQGTVVVRVLVNKTGSYSDHKVINQVHPILTKAVEKQIHRLTFTPAIQGGKPIPFWVNIPFHFQLLGN